MPQRGVRTDAPIILYKSHEGNRGQKIAHIFKNHIKRFENILHCVAASASPFLTFPKPYWRDLVAFI